MGIPFYKVDDFVSNEKMGDAVVKIHFWSILFQNINPD